jgi:hypothetical protein
MFISEETNVKDPCPEPLSPLIAQPWAESWPLHSLSDPIPCQASLQASWPCLPSALTPSTIPSDIV